MTLGDPASGQPFARANGYTPSNRQNAINPKTPSWEDGQQQRLDTDRTGLPAARFPHIKDLQQKATAAVKNIDPHIPVCQCLLRRERLLETRTEISGFWLICLRLATC